MLRFFIRTFSRRTLAFLVVVLTISSGGVVAYAECGFEGGGGGGGTYYPPAPTVAPNPVSAGGQLSVTAFGLTRPVAYDIRLTAGCCMYAWSSVIGQTTPDFTGNTPPTSVTVPAGLVSTSYDVVLRSTDGQEEADRALVDVNGDAETDDENLDESLTDGGDTTVPGEELRVKRREFETTTRPEYWKREAANNPSKYSEADLERMRQGKGPIGSDGYPLELHHKTPLKRGGSNEASNLEPMTRTRHRLGGNYRRNHPE